jgi:hypothetical protein
MDTKEITQVWQDGAELANYLVDTLKERGYNESPHVGLVGCAILYGSIAKLLGMSTHETLELVMVVSKKLEEKSDKLQ